LETPILPSSSQIVYFQLNGSRRLTTLMTQKRKMNKATTARAAMMRKTRSIIRRHSRDTSS
jgi:hypothetical protein